jgi:hypothetical protein
MNYRFRLFCIGLMSNFTQLSFFINGAMFIACKADVFAPNPLVLFVGILILEKNTILHYLKFLLSNIN